MKKIILSIAMWLPLLLAGCSSDSLYQPDTEEVTDCMGVYFVQDATSGETIIEGDERSLTLTLKRTESSAAATVPVTVVSSDAVFQIPATVEFGAGDSEAGLTIGFPSIEAGQKYHFEVAVDDRRYADPYRQYADGATHFSTTVSLETWEVLARAEFYFEDYRFDVFQADIWQVAGGNKYKIEDFLNSGTDLVFTLDNGTYMAPQGGWLDGDNNFWYLYDNAADDYIPCYPANAQGIYFSAFSCYLDGFSYLDVNDRSGCIYASVFASDATSWAYNPLYFYW